jgi:hypothetical protein
MSLHPQIRRTLEAFHQRRLRLLWVRILCSSLALLLGGGLFFGLFDWGFLLPDPLRLGLSITLYLLVLLNLIWRGLLPALQPSDPRSVARQIESLHPTPHHQFLAAVELGLDSRSETLDSPEFRERIQVLGAGAGSETLPMQALPWRRIRADLLAASLAACALGAILLATHGNFSISLLRTLAPTAPIERLSRFQITVLQPSAPRGLVPSDEKLTIEASVAGPTPTSPTLEWIAPEGRTVHAMTPSESGRFIAQVPVGNAPAAFRIRAGDARTRTFPVQPTPRPSAVRFEKTIQPPVYSGISTQTVSEADGHLRALFGSSASLNIELSEAVSAASLILHRGEQTESVPLPITQPTRILQHQLPIDDSLSYHLQLVSAKTGFASLPAPQHEIRAETDLPPTLTLDAPRQDQTLRLGLTVEVHLQAGDDLGLVQLRQRLQINGGPWHDLPARSLQEKNFELRESWDPLHHGAKPGDLLITQFVAIDSLGQVAESRSVRITLLQPEADPKRSRDLALSRQVQEQLQSLVKETRDASSALTEFRSQTDSQSPNLIRRDQSAGTAQRAAQDALQKAADARLTVAQAIRENSDPASGAFLQDLAHLLNRLQFSLLETARDSLLEAMDPSTSRQADRKEAVRVALDSIGKANAQATQLHEAFKPQLAALESATAAENAKALAAEQRAIAEASGTTEPAAEPPKTNDPEHKRRQQINEAAVRALQKDLSLLKEHASGDRSVQERLKATQDELQKRRIQIEKSLVMDEVGPNAKQVAVALAEGLEKTHSNLESLSPALEQSAAKARESLARTKESTADHLQKLGRNLESLTKRTDLSPAAKQAQIALQTAAEAASVQAEATLQSSLDPTKAAWASDLNTAARALRALASPPSAPSPEATTLAGLAQMLRPLETSARLQDAGQKANALGQHRDPDSIAQPKSDLNRSLDVLERAASHSGLTPEAQGHLQKALGSDATKRLRINPSAGPESMDPGATPREDATALAEQLDQAAALAAEAVSQARQALHKAAPSASEEFKRLAAEAALAGEQNKRLAQTLPAPSPDSPNTPSPANSNPAEPAQTVSDAQKQENLQNRQRMGARESLLQEANQQDLLSEEGRQRARDADAANALLKNADKASESLQKAAESRDAQQQAGLLQEAATQQKQAAQQLAQIAEHLKNLEDGNTDEIAKSRKALREAEAQAGLSRSLEASQKRSEELAKISNATRDEAKQKLEELLRNANPEGSSRGKSQANTPGKPGSREASALQKALDSLNQETPSGKELPSSTASSLAEAAKANQDAQRNNRLQKSTRESANGSGDQAAASMENEAQDGPGLDTLPSLSRSGSSDWGKLPRRLAKDLMEGKRETPGGEYQTAIESYFRAIAEKARGPAQ